MSDEELWRLKRGGHDPAKVYAAYARRGSTPGQPTVILAKTVKGYGMGEAGEGQNITHQQKKMGESAEAVSGSLQHPDLRRAESTSCPSTSPTKTSAAVRYVRERREALGGYLPAQDPSRAARSSRLSAFSALLEGSGDREALDHDGLCPSLDGSDRDKGSRSTSSRSSPTRPAPSGWKACSGRSGSMLPRPALHPEDADQLAYYREESHGQILQEGISEAGALSSWIAAGTSYCQPRIHMIPFFIFYSMFGFQRVGDLIWAAADMRARASLMGATSGRTTLNGEGLQHQDGQSHLISARFRIASPTTRRSATSWR